MNARYDAVVGKYVAPSSFGLASSANFRSIALLPRVRAQEVERLPESLDRIDRILRGVHFGAFAAAPEHVGRGAPIRRRGPSRIVFCSA